MTRERFDDLVVPLDHEWVTKYRLPAVEGFSSTWRYPLTCAYPTGEQNYLNPDLIMPTDEEVALLSAYNLFRLQRLFTDHIIETSIRKYELDLDTGAIYHFGKSSAVGWQYRMSTWRHGEIPHQYDAAHTERYWNLIDILNAVERRESSMWVEWKSAQSALIEAANAPNRVAALV